MNPKIPGYVYELANHGGAGQQTLAFVQRRPEASPVLLNAQKENLQKPAPMATVIEGTTNEEVLAALLHRLIHLNQLLPCTENFLAAHHIELALTTLNNRTQDRLKRGVEGTAQR